MRVKGGADTGLAPDCIYSSTKRFTFTKSFQLHGARRISTLLSSFGDVILLAAIAERRGCEQLYDSLSLSVFPFFVTPLPLSLSVSLFPNDFKVVAGNRFANPWRRRIGAFRTLAPRFHFAHNSTSTLSLFPPLVIYNRFSPFFAPTIQKSRLPCKLVPSLLLSYIIIHGDSCAHPAKK